MRKKAILVGCGNMAATWVRALREPALKDRVVLTGLVDLDLAAAERLRSEFDISECPAGIDLDGMLSDLRPQIVFDVAVPSARLDVVKTSLGRGCHVLSEKPMATTMEDARKIRQAASRAGRLFAVCQNRRFKEGIRRVRATIESGLLGTVNAIHCDFFVGAHFGGFRDVMQHVLLLDMAIHTFDAARFLSGQEPVAVYCHESNPSGSWYAYGSAANAIFEFTGDVIFTYRGSWSAEGANTSWDSAWRIVGPRGTLLWDGEDHFALNVVDGNDGFFRPLRQVDVPPAPDPRLANGHVSVIDDFLGAIENGREPETSGRDNIRSLAMVFSAIESAAARRRVPIDVQEAA
ncbi:Gfo/Idh/MocA family oxidoreductase [Mesorhizobium sp. KR9-304]|uniref:Gfo/Idh/MocA family protein n=1 Tax=Mesorhizobium sp. KR9-304 TaxID=3156614 RepID=UPI0032B60487